MSSEHRELVIRAIPLFIFVALFLGGAAARIGALRKDDTVPVNVSATLVKGAADGPLMVIVPGLNQGTWWPFATGDPVERYRGITADLTTRGDVLILGYPNGLVSNASPRGIARALADKIRAEWSRNPRDIQLIGHSIGALLVRQAMLEPVAQAWVGQVKRVVLLAGMNRGWDITGHKPFDMRWGRYVAVGLGVWFARHFGLGTLWLEVEAGSPFVAGLRLRWMEWFRIHEANAPEVVQLLGDIDDIVSDADNKDLRVVATNKFAWLKVRGTGHADVIDVTDSTSGLGAYRLAKLRFALREPFYRLLEESEEQSLPTNHDVRHVVFVVHGIRDLGRWSSVFEVALKQRIDALREEGAGANDVGTLPPENLVLSGPLSVASIRYGYFGMGPFLLRLNRMK